MSPLLTHAPWFYYAFGVLTVVGGVMGFVKAKSKASLIAGGVAGALMVVAAWLMQTQGRTGLLMAFFLCFVLLSRFLPAFFTTRKWMPAGMMTVLSVLGIGLALLVVFS